MVWPDSRLWFSGLVVFVALLRLVELAVSRRNVGRMMARGGVEVGGALYPWMVAVHTGFLVSCVAEVWLLDRPLIPVLAVAASAAVIAAAGLRWWVMATLGDRWSTRVVIVKDEPPIAAGPFRHLRHPNYLAVAVEFVALPLVHTAWLTALLFSLANAAILVRRIRTEERALTGAGGYAELLGNRGRLIPGRK